MPRWPDEIRIDDVKYRVTVQGVEDGDPKVTLDNSPIVKYVGVDEWAARQATEAAWERRFRTDEPMEP